MNKTIVVNVEKCLACKSCELACALVHSKSQVLEEAIAESPKPQSRVSVEASGDCGVPMQCRHCEDAPCISVCPTEAIHRHQVNTPVLIETDKCIGCGYCLMVCPFGVIDVTRDGKAVAKCDLCVERTKVGELPACVVSCPTGALEFGELSDYLVKRRRAAAAAVVAAAEKGKAIEDSVDGPDKG